MHGELMEFNETLQKQLMSRESHLKRLTEELIGLRGPVGVCMSVHTHCISWYLFITFLLLNVIVALP